MKQFFILAGLMSLGLSTNGCVAAAVGAGVVAADELMEDDGKFDPLEEAYDGDDTTDPILEED